MCVVRSHIYQQYNEIIKKIYQRNYTINPNLNLNFINTLEFIKKKNNKDRNAGRLKSDQ